MTVTSFFYGKYSCIEKFSNTYSEYKASYCIPNNYLKTFWCNCKDTIALKVFKHLLGIWNIIFVFRTIVWKLFNATLFPIHRQSQQVSAISQHYWDFKTLLDTCSSYTYSKQVFENFSMQLYFPFIGNLSKSQQYLSIANTSKHS